MPGETTPQIQEALAAATNLSGVAVSAEKRITEHRAAELAAVNTVRDALEGVSPAQELAAELLVI